MSIVMSNGGGKVYGNVTVEVLPAVVTSACTLIPAIARLLTVATSVVLQNVFAVGVMCKSSKSLYRWTKS